MFVLVIVLSSTLLSSGEPGLRSAVPRLLSLLQQTRTSPAAEAARKRAEEVRARAEANRAAREAARASATADAAKAREKEAEDAARACQTYVTLLRTLDKEMVGIKVDTLPVEQVFTRAINVFRDDYFVPLFGKPLQAIADKERNDYRLVLRTRCPQLDPADREVYRRWDVIVGPVFMGGSGSQGAAVAISGLAERQELIEQMKKATDAPLPAGTAGDFEAMNKQIELAKVSLKKLWPREEREFLQALTSRRDRLAGSSPEAGKQITIAASIKGPEGSTTGGRPTGVDFVYIDAAIKNGANGNLEVMPVEEVFQWLYDAKFKCLGTQQVLWRGTEGRADGRQF